MRSRSWFRLGKEQAKEQEKLAAFALADGEATT
jgi:hypothetical protein